MPWKKMLAYVTGEIEESLLLRIEYLIEENRVLRNQIDKRILLTDAERTILAEKAVALGKLMVDTVTIVKPWTSADCDVTFTGTGSGTTCPRAFTASWRITTGGVGVNAGPGNLPWLGDVQPQASGAMVASIANNNPTRPVTAARMPMRETSLAFISVPPLI